MLDRLGVEAARVEDSADFILQANYQDCAGFMTFGPGSTYGEDGTGAETIYMILTWLGIFVTLAVLAAEPGMFLHRGRWYQMMGVDLGEYRNHMRRRSAKWETVALPAEDFRSLARPIETWL